MNVILKKVNQQNSFVIFHVAGVSTNTYYLRS